ncbi:MAG: AraC family transcriptional regulator [Verrucomicrobia bacterium]|nr:AraC family transcriptional regulator [Verrucomicrobiota bacterium]
MDWQALGPLLVHIQANLGEDLSLAALSRRMGYSEFHLQRNFRSLLGESPRAYVERLRLERAAFRLAVQRASILEVALEVGFRRPESFLRAFQRRFGQSPSAYRRGMGAGAAPADEPGPIELNAGSELSETRVAYLRPLEVAFCRHVGPYESVPESLFDELERWRSARARRLPPIWLGIGHDAPGITPAAQLRFDAALLVDGPIAPTKSIAFQALPGGPHAVTTHVGPFADLPAAYARIFPRLLHLRGWEPVGLPALEFYATRRVDVHYALNQTEIWLPLRRGSRRATQAPRRGCGL